MLTPDNYYAVQGWMVTELGLSGNELAAYAIIYGFSQDGASRFSGSIAYLMEWLGCGRVTAINVLKSLVEKGLVNKKTVANGSGPNEYTTVPRENIARTKIERDPVQKLNGTRTKIEPNNKYYNKPDNYIDKERERDAAAAPAAPPPDEDRKTKHKHGEYKNVLLTTEELQSLQARFPGDWQQRIDRLSEYIASKGVKYKSHYATILAWARRDAERGRPASRSAAPGMVGPNGIPIDPTMTDMDDMFR